MRDTERKRERERERERQAEGEAGSMQGARRGTQSWDPRIIPQAAGGAKLLRHRGCLFQVHFKSRNTPMHEPLFINIHKH